MSIVSLSKGPLRSGFLRSFVLRRSARSLSMQTIQVDSRGTEFSYIDSGAPPGGTYTTLVCVHGHTYHAQNFRRLLPVAQKYNLRVIAFNRRDYVGSTPFSPNELEAINSTDSEKHTEFLKNRGSEVAQFLANVVKEKDIPPASEDGKSGGLAIMGWSLGNVTTMAFLRHLESYPEAVLSTLDKYLRTFFIYECAYSSLGYPPPEGSYHPLTDPSIPPDHRASVFGTWVSSYYSHPYYSSPSTSSAQDMSKLQARVPTSPIRPATVDHSFTTDDIKECTDLSPAARSEQAFFSKLKPAPQYEQMSNAIVLRPESPPLRKLKVCMVYGLSSVWSIPWAVWELEKDVKRWSEEGKTIRPIKFLPVEGANHFLHWDDPDLFLKTFADGIRS